MSKTVLGVGVSAVLGALLAWGGWQAFASFKDETPSAWPGPPAAACLMSSPHSPDAPPNEGMIRIAGGTFLMGSDDGYRDEGPAHAVTLDPFWIDAHEVTNAQFAAFVAATGYVTTAERPPNPEEIPGAPAYMLEPGSAVFTPPRDPHSATDWWDYVPGANWRAPYGPGSSIEGREHEPVVHVTYEDATAYADWLGRALPTEAQFEFAQRGGTDTTYAWGEERTPGGAHQANTWQGFFPFQDTVDDGFAGAAPAGCFPANGYGLFDMTGNVWEWTNDWYAPRHDPRDAVNPTGPAAQASLDPRQGQFPVRVMRGGSFLCAPNYCVRFRSAARHAQDVGLGSNHIGFRTVWNEPAPEPT